MTDAEQIRGLLQARADALHARDPLASVAVLADEVVSYDLAPPLAHAIGATRDRSDLERWYATWATPIASEAPDQHIEVSGDLALAYGLVHMTGAKTDGEAVDIWFRSTLGLRRIAGAWKIVHEHASTPFYMDGSQRAATDLKPKAQAPAGRV